VSAEATIREKFTGLLVGTAVGDALGLPAENLSPQKIQRRWKGEWRMRLFFGRGMFSDDTEHTLMVAQSILSHPSDAAAFQLSLAWKLRWWFAALPGGVGLATARACVKLWFGFPGNKSGVHSAGAGPAMRSAIIGAFFASDPKRRAEFVRASTFLTHTAWQSDIAALAIAECAAFAINSQTDSAVVLSRLRALDSEREWDSRLNSIEDSLGANHTVGEFAAGIGLSKGVTGYSLHVVTVAIYAWLRHPQNFRAALVEALDCGGDTDTVGAILGALCGTTVGQAGIPADWIGDIADWPRSTRFIKSVAQKLADQINSKTPLGPVSYFWPAVIARNLLFLAIILVHGFRRLLPPY
jgi:ADP-ribosyl-[dinitrogen reductase] hydrolase